jgi:hypothetical protein
MNAVTYVGNGTSKVVSGLNFQPDLVWVKNRTSAQNHRLCNSVTGNALSMSPNTTAAEAVGGGYFTSIDPTGFTTGNAPDVNNNGDNHVAWLWKKGSTPGFDIQTNVTKSVPCSHTLGAVPAFMIFRDPTATSAWCIWHKSITTDGGGQYLSFNTIGGNVHGSSGFTGVTSSSVTVGTGFWNGSTNGRLFLWAEIPGFSKFGSYTGNGSADGTFVYCGFRPSWVMLKNITSSGYNWFMFDTVRGTYNLVNIYLYPDAPNGDQTNGSFDILSNGFKIRANDQTNLSGSTYIFAAFAELPFGGGNVSPATAR